MFGGGGVKGIGTVGGSVVGVVSGMSGGVAGRAALGK